MELVLTHNFLRAEASSNILKFRVSKMVFPVVFRRYLPPQTPCCLVRIHARLGTMSSKCPRHSTTWHGLNISHRSKPVSMCQMSFKTGKWMVYNFIRWCLFFVNNYGRR